MREAALQNEIRAALGARGVHVFRSNVVSGWHGRVVSQSGGRVTLEGARLVTSGLPHGWPDLTGWTADGRMIALEVKTPRGRLSPEQARLLEVMRACGVIAGVVRSVDDALDLLGLSG